MKIGDYVRAASLYNTESKIALGPIYGGNFNMFKTGLKLQSSGTAGSL
jgi:hypothetical protein